MPFFSSGEGIEVAQERAVCPSISHPSHIVDQLWDFTDRPPGQTRCVSRMHIGPSVVCLAFTCLPAGGRIERNAIETGFSPNYRRIP